MQTRLFLWGVPPDLVKAVMKGAAVRYGEVWKPAVFTAVYPGGSDLRTKFFRPSPRPMVSS